MPGSIRMSMMIRSSARPGASCRVHMGNVFFRRGYPINRGNSGRGRSFQPNVAPPRKIGG